MLKHEVRAHPSKEDLPRLEQLAWKIAQVATDHVAIDDDVAEMVINRIIDNASVAIASLNRGPIKSARAMSRATTCCPSLRNSAPSTRLVFAVSMCRSPSAFSSFSRSFQNISATVAPDSPLCR